MLPEEQTGTATAPVQDPAGTAPAVAEQPVPTPTPAQPAPPATAPAKTPWDADLAVLFPDEATRSQVSAYLGQKVQPYVTQLEQSNVEAKELLDDFRSSPKETFLEVAQELVDEGAITPEDLTDYLGTLTPAEQAEVAEAAAEQVAAAPARDPEVQALLDAKRDADEEAAFYESLEATRESEKVAAAAQGREPLAFDEDLFIPIVASTGDFAEAAKVYAEKYAGYEAYRRANPPAETPQPTPPATLGTGEAAAGSTPPATEVKYETIGEAVDAWAQEEVARGGTPIPKPPAPPVATT